MVKCNKAFSNPWACVHCKHAKPHVAAPIRKGTKVDLLCSDFGDYCQETQQRVKCAPVESETA